MTPLFAIPGTQKIVWTLIHFLWQGAVLGLMAWGTSFLLRWKRPQVRYVALCLFMAACLVAPLVTFLRLPAPPAPVSIVAPRESLRSFEHRDLQGAPEAAPVTHTQPPLAWRTYVQPLLPWILPLWVLGFCVLSIRTIGGWFYLRRLKLEGDPILQELWTDRLRLVIRNSGVRRAVHFLESDRISGPMAMGILKPIILVPFGFFTNLDPIAVEALLAHEMAHVRRYDVLVNALQCAMETLFFFHPAIWWISRRIRTEREHCCDDAAVQVCGDPVLYAEVLNQLSHLRESLPQLATGAKGGSVMERMRRLLAPDPLPMRIAAPGFSVLLAFCLGSMALLSQQENVKQAIREIPKRLVESGEQWLFPAPEKVNAVTIPPVQQDVASTNAPQIIKGLSSKRAASSVSAPIPLGQDASVPSISLSNHQEQDRSHIPVVRESSAVDENPREVTFAKPRNETSRETWVAKSDGASLELWPAGSNHLEAASLPSTCLFILRDINGVNASRILRLKVQPGEKLVFHLDGEDVSKVAMAALIPYKSSDLNWEMALRNANFPPPQIRNRKFEVSNPTFQSQVFDLALYGARGYSYRIDLNRVPVAPSKIN